jgi:hypothetical protein
MPMYRFEIVDGVRLSDPVGLRCDDSYDAKEKAKIIATHIASDAPPRKPRWIMVLDEEGNEVHKAAITAHSPRLSGERRNCCCPLRLPIRQVIFQEYNGS